MGGIDQLDQSVAAYRTRMRQKKWWWPIFIYFFDVTIVNAWMLWRKKKENRKVQLLSFKGQLAISLLKQYDTPSRLGKQTAPPIECVRFDGKGH